MTQDEKPEIIFQNDASKQDYIMVPKDIFKQIFPKGLNGDDVIGRKRSFKTKLKECFMIFGQCCKRKSKIL